VHIAGPSQPEPPKSLRKGQTRITIQPSADVIPGRAAALARILIVDDDNSLQVTLRLLLEGAGHDVVAANAGRRGLHLLDAGTFDLLILDIFMPGMDGFETLRLVRQQKASLPIIAISGRPVPTGPDEAPDFLVMATKLGAVRSLHKPFRASVLLATVAACLDAANRPSSQAGAGRIVSGH
jgi:DNA-binding response OmpR family regulator